MKHQPKHPVYPTALIFASVFLGYLVFFLPWTNLTVRPLINPHPFDPSKILTPEPKPTDPASVILTIGASTQMHARYWELQPTLYTGESAPGLSPICWIWQIRWSSDTISQSFTWLQRAGWLAAFVELGLWLIGVAVHRKEKPVISPIGFALICVFACLVGIVFLAYIGPSSSCIGFAGVVVDGVSPSWVGIVVSLTSIGTGIAGIIVSPSASVRVGRAD